MRDDPHAIIEVELSGLPLRFTFDSGTKNPYVTIINEALNDHRRIVFSRAPGPNDLANIRSDVRRAIRQLGCQPHGTLGKKIAEVIKKEELPMSSQPQTKPNPIANTNYAQQFQKRVSQPDTTSKPVPMPVIAITPEEPKEKKVRSQLNQREVAFVTMLLVQHSTFDINLKTFEYAAGWDDTRILKLVAIEDRKHIQLHSISDLRQENFGFTPKEVADRERQLVENAARAREAKAGLGVLARFAAIEARLDALEGAVIGPTKGAA
jgi:hypothetical protein